MVALVEDPQIEIDLFQGSGPRVPETLNCVRSQNGNPMYTDNLMSTTRLQFSRLPVR